MLRAHELQCGVSAWHCVRNLLVSHFSKCRSAVFMFSSSFDGRNCCKSRVKAAVWRNMLSSPPPPHWGASLGKARFIYLCVADPTGKKKGRNNKLGLSFMSVWKIVSFEPYIINVLMLMVIQMIARHVKGLTHGEKYTDIFFRPSQCNLIPTFLQLTLLDYSLCFCGVRFFILLSRSIKPRVQQTDTKTN